MSGSIHMPPESRPDTLPAIPRQRVPGWAQPDPVDELAARLGDFVAAAVHPDEIAALLESDGMSDDRIREQYGVKNSFALAEELYGRVPRRHPEPHRPPRDPWRAGLSACLLRGVVFALPGLGYVLAAPFLTDTLPLLAGALAGWAWNQGLAHRAYTWLGAADPAAARRALLRGAPPGILLGALTALAVSARTDPTTLAFAAAQALYLAAATTLLVLGRERALFLALSPLSAGAPLTLLHPVPGPLRLTLLLLSLTAVAVLGLVEASPAIRAPKGRGALFGVRSPVRGRVQPPPTRRRPTTTAPRIIGSLPHALFGLATGTLVLFSHRNAIVALTLSMGPAEWLLHRFRSAGHTALRASTTPTAFRRRITRTAAACLSAYLAVLLALALTTAATGVHLADLLLLGVVLWTGLLLQSFGAVESATATCCAAALAQTAALLTHTGTPDTVGLLAHGTAAAVQAALVYGLSGKATTHR
ncbi:hypothetical protein ACYF6T_38425 [Streptomyces sp. 7R007]